MKIHAGGKKYLYLAISILFLSNVSVFAEADSEKLAETVQHISVSLDTVWLILCAALVFFMQAGFAMVETGLTRAKNAGNVLMKNLLDFSAGSIAYWAVGWGLMYGISVGGLLGGDSFFLNGDEVVMRDWFFQAVFAAAAATIVSGAMAERTKFSSYLIYSVIVSALIYPVSGHWVWQENGWLTQLGFHDFAGSSVVHGLGGGVALAGAFVLGPRIGKYIKVEGKIHRKPIMGHNIPLAALGVFILWFGWYGFNAGSTLSGTDLSMAKVAANTTLAASAGGILAMITVWILSGKPDVSMTLNGSLAGLVSITASCAVVGPGTSIIIGAVGGTLVVLAVEFVDRVLKIDDPVGAFSVHGLGGIWGTLAVGIFGDLEAIGSGLSRGGQFGIQLLGALSICVWGFLAGSIVFRLIKATVGLRVSESEELSGLDVDEHGMEAYSGFQIFQNV